MKKISHTLSLLYACAALALPAWGADAGFKPLFNGHDLTNWDGNPAVWSVKDGTITGVTQGPESLPYNQFIIWRGGTVKNFELHAKIRQTGNNSGIQYRSQEMPAIGRWSVGGYQCDIHSKVSSNGKLYEEQFRTTVAENGQSILVDPAGDRWLLAERKPVEVDSGQWNDFTIIAQGNHVIHKINGQVTVEVWDYETGKYARRTEGLLAIQIHRGPAMNVQAKDIEIKVLPDTADKPFDRASIPASAKKLEPPATAPKKA
jgi:hypothetical protein